MAIEIINKLKKKLLVFIIVAISLGVGLTISATYNVKQHKQIVQILETYDADIPRADMPAVKRRKGKQ